MAWTIHRWSADRGVGEIRSPHFGPIPFDANANVDAVHDFTEGEPVLVELDGQAPAFRVRVIRPFRQRQPPGTHWPPFDAVNGFGDASVEERSTRAIQFWIGDCCQYCTPNPMHVRFDDVSVVAGLDDMTCF